MASTTNSTVNSFYLAFYGRPADPAGMKYWAEQLTKANGNIDAIKTAFATSEEAKVRFGTDTAAERITEIYQQLFNRAPEPAGLAYWVDAVAKGHATLADVAITVLGSSQGADSTLSTMRQQAADSFTAQVEASGSAYSGNAAVEAARVLVRAVTLNTKKVDIDALVKSTAALAEVATKTPEAVAALGTGSELLGLFDTKQGSADPVSLVDTLVETARSAASNPSIVATLMRGGGMPGLLKQLPEGVTIKDLKDQIGKGGMKAALESLFGDKPGNGPNPTQPGTPSSLTLDFHLTEGNGSVILESSAADITGMGNAAGLVVQDISTATPKAVTGFTIDGDELAFAAPLAAGLYQATWKDDTFTTATGHAAAGSLTFAGGRDGLFSQEGFTVAKVSTISANALRAATENVNEAFVAGGTATLRIATGGGHDVVVDQGAKVAIVVDTIDGTSADLVLGFDTGNDTVSLEGKAATAIDDNADGKIQWASAGAALEATAEAVSVMVATAVTLGSTAAVTQTLLALNTALDFSKIALNDELLILAEGATGTGAALFQYVNKDGNGKIDAAELTEIAMFAGGAPEQVDIVLVGAAPVATP